LRCAPFCQSSSHRPELALTDDGDLLVIVVEHLDTEAGKVSHMGYRFDADFVPVIDPFVVAMDTDEYGHGPGTVPHARAHRSSRWH
jgi:hypothetical protein